MGKLKIKGVVATNKAATTKYKVKKSAPWRYSVHIPRRNNPMEYK